MGQTARVHSVESIERFRASLCEFGKDTKDTLCAVDMTIRRTFDWLADQGKYWVREVKLRQEGVVRAKIELESRKAMCKDGRGPGTSSQEKALQKAQKRLKEAEEKVANCKRWGPLLQHAVHEYQGAARVLGATLDIDLVQSLNLLRQKLDALEAYLALAPPSLPEPVSVASSAESPRFAQSTADPVPAVEEPKEEEQPAPAVQ